MSKLSKTFETRQMRKVSAIMNNRLRRRDKGRGYTRDTSLLADGRIISRRVTPRTRTHTDNRDHEGTLVERFTNTGIDNKNLPLGPHTIGAHGNAGVGFLGVIGQCSACKRRNKIIGPISSPASRQVCQPTCEAQKGAHPVKDKVRFMAPARVG